MRSGEEYLEYFSRWQIDVNVFIGLLRPAAVEMSKVRVLLAKRPAAPEGVCRGNTDRIMAIAGRQDLNALKTFNVYLFLKR